MMMLKARILRCPPAFVSEDMTAGEVFHDACQTASLKQHGELLHVEPCHDRRVSTTLCATSLKKNDIV